MDSIKPLKIRGSLRYLLGALFLASKVASQDEVVPSFLFPATDQIFYQGDIVNVSYISPYEEVVLWCFCDNSNIRTIFTEDAPPFNGSVSKSIDFTSDKPCWYNFRSVANESLGANSAAFNVVGQTRPGGPQVLGAKEEDSQTSSSSVTTSGTPSTTSSSTSGSSPTSTGAESQGQQDRNESSKLSTGAKAGIGIGAWIGASLILGLIYYLWRRRQRGSNDKLLHGGAGPAASSGGMNQYTAYNAPNQGPSPAYSGLGGVGVGTYKPVESPEQGHLTMYSEMQNGPERHEVDEQGMTGGGVVSGGHDAKGYGGVGQGIQELGSSNYPAEMPGR